MKSISLTKPCSYFYRAVALVTVVALINSATGCTKMVKVAASEISREESERFPSEQHVTHIRAVQLKDGNKIEFEDPGGMIAPGSDVIVGLTKEYRQGKRWLGGDPIEIRLDEVESLVFKRHSRTKTAILWIGVGIVVLMAAAAIALNAEKGSTSTWF